MSSLNDYVESRNSPNVRKRRATEGSLSAYMESRREDSLKLDSIVIRGAEKGGLLVECHFIGGKSPDVEKFKTVDDMLDYLADELGSPDDDDSENGDDQ